LRWGLVPRFRASRGKKGALVRYDQFVWMMPGPTPRGKAGTDNFLDTGLARVLEKAAKKMSESDEKMMKEAEEAGDDSEPQAGAYTPPLLCST